MLTENKYAQNLLVHFRCAEQIKAQSLHFKSIALNNRQLCDLELLLTRAYYPLNGFMTRADYDSVLDTMRLADGTLWPLPVCLDIDERLAETLNRGEQVALRDNEGFMLAVLTVEDLWQPDLRQEALAVFGTAAGDDHPGVRAFLGETRPYYVGGPLQGLALPPHFDFQELRRGPTETQASFLQHGWRAVAGYQTGAILHCAHKAAITHAVKEIGAGVLLHTSMEDTLLGSAESFARVRCVKRFVQTFPPDMVQLGLLPMHMRQAGPREALLEAILHKNYGCSHFFVAPDQADPFAGQANALFYPSGKAQEVVRAYGAELGLTMLPLSPMVYVEEKAEYIPAANVSPGMTVKTLDPQEFKRRLEFNLDIPEWFTFPEIVAELRLAYPPRSKQGFTIFMTGLSGAGKSTLAKLLYVKFMEMRSRPVTLLDGDIVRRHLSSELTFSKEHRNLNIQRIGFVASEITKNGGIALCAPIAPYAEARRYVRDLIRRHGGFIEVHVATPLQVCEQRDRKGLYAKARAGIVKGVTGIDDVYEVPTQAEIVLDTSCLTPLEAAQDILFYLEKQGYIR